MRRVLISVLVGLALAGPAQAANPWDPTITYNTNIPGSHAPRACAVRMYSIVVAQMQAKGWPVVMPDLYTFDTEVRAEGRVGTLTQFDGEAPVVVAGMYFPWAGRHITIVSPTTERELCRYRSFLRKPWMWSSTGIDALDTAAHETLHQLTGDHSLIEPWSDTIANRIERLRQAGRLRP